MSVPSDAAGLSRRELLRRTGEIVGGAALATAAVSLAAPATAGAAPRRLSPTRAIQGDEVLMGLYPSSVAPTGDAALSLAIPNLDLSWLKPGDSVFIKVQSNSPNVHPATTSPGAVAAMVRALYAFGAGQVIVGDQAGVQWVRLAEGNQRYSSTRDVFARNGLGPAATSEGAELHFFDEQDYDDGYVVGVEDFDDSHWEAPPRIPRIVEEVDHIVYLCRLSSHSIAGYTHGHKTAIGWLRDDSRFLLHNKASTFYEKYVEINHLQQIRDRLRLTVTVAEQILLDAGPDVGTLATMDPRVVLASRDMANHDALAVGILAWMDGITPPDPDVKGVYGRKSNLYNLGLVTVGTKQTGIPWGDSRLPSYTSLTPHAYQEGVAYDRALTRAYELQGGMPTQIPILLAGSPPSPGLTSGLDEYGGGLFTYL